MTKRCFGDGRPEYADYHDREWGVPVYDDTRLFEMLILEGAQAGLSFETVLKKREGYRKAFHDFDPVRVAALTDDDLIRLAKDPGIIRHRLKIESARKNARVFLRIQEEFGTFRDYLWAFVDNKPVIGHYRSLKEIPSRSALADRLSDDLRKRGMNFVGPTIIYAYMQAVGMVNDHILSCPCRLNRYSPNVSLPSPEERNK